MKKMLKFSVFLLFCAFLSPALAEIRLNGFGSMIVGKTLDSTESIYGYDDALKFEPDSFFALQTYADLGDGLSATVQFAAEGGDGYEVTMEWAFMSYQIAENTKLNMGKLRLPLYTNSEFVDVGYAYHWLRPPDSVYGSSPFNSISGLGLIHTTPLGDWSLQTQLSYGEDSNLEFFLGQTEITGSVEGFTGVAFELSREWFMLRFSGYVTRATFSEPSLDALNNTLLSEGLVALADQLSIDDDKGYFYSFGFDIDKRHLIVSAEMSLQRAENMPYPDGEQWYISAGYRMGAFTPHITYEDSSSEIGSNAIDVAPTPELQQLARSVLEGALVSNSAYKLGLRYDFHPSAAFKVELTSFDDDRDDNRSADLVSFGIDLLF